MATNTDQNALKAFVDRFVAIESEFLEHKSERDDSINDLKTEIKGRKEETGITPQEVQRLAKIRLKEQEAREQLEQADTDMATYDLLYGKSSDDEDPLG